MQHIFQTSDEQYAKLAAYAAQRGQTPETLFEEWVRMITRETDKLPSVTSGSSSQKVQSPRHQEESAESPLLQVAGMFSIREPGWADQHDEYLAQTYLENHADSKSTRL